MDPQQRFNIAVSAMGSTQAAKTIAAYITSPSFTGWIPHTDAENLATQLGLSAEEMATKYLVSAAKALYPVIPISQFPVGVAGIGKSGAVYLGANMEFVGAPIGLSVHGEGSCIVNALSHGDKLKILAVNAAPCGHCRQFISEFHEWDELIVTWADKRMTLRQILPAGFKGSEFCSDPGTPGTLAFSSSPPDYLCDAAVKAANKSHCPYSHGYCGAAILLSNGKVFTGSYLEDAAFNPSITPLASALICCHISGSSIKDIQRAVFVGIQGSGFKYDMISRELLASVAPGVPLEVHYLFPHGKKHARL